MTNNSTNNSFGKFVWFEYVSKQAPKAQGFFGELFGWKKQDVPMPGGDYTMIALGDRTIGGYLDTPEGVPTQAHWLTHLRVANADAAAAKVKSLGGTIMKEPFKVGEFGTMAIAIDPHGGAFALWQPAKTEPDAAPSDHAFCWNELYSKDPAASVAFYSAVGGFTVKQQDMPGMGAYYVLEAGGQPRAGIMASPMPQAPHAWLPYVAVANADATADKAKRLGATSLVPPTDIPGVGRFSIIVDPQGATIGILQAEAQG
ncbi:MAG: VOC family protein [Deltaproteobacteria bacterium]|nr:VOC family protein [Deltaproteobacteria bacterium]